MKVCMIAGNNADYIFSLVQALSRLGLSLELLGGNDYEHLDYAPCVTFVKVRHSQDSSASLWAKAIRIVRYYYRCVTYLRKSDVDIVHIQAFHFKFLEGIILVYLFKRFGKRVVYTAHNVQTKGKNDTLTHIVHLLIYRNVHHIICHTMDIKNKLLSRYGITSEKISVIQRGVNSLVPITTLSQCEARRRLNIDPQSRVLLLFGRIRPVKGYEIVLQALGDLLPSIQPVTLLIAGNAVNQANQNYLEELRRYVKEKNLENVVQFHTYHIPEEHIELFFKATDVVLLPYVESDFQSGVLFLALRFGVPVIASDISLLPEAIAQGVWGYIFDVGNPRDLAAKIVQFFRDLQPRCGLRQSIQEYGRKQYSWEATAMATVDAYHRVLKHRSRRPSL